MILSRLLKGEVKVGQAVLELEAPEAKDVTTLVNGQVQLN